MINYLIGFYIGSAITTFVYGDLVAGCWYNLPKQVMSYGTNKLIAWFCAIFYSFFNPIGTIIRIIYFIRLINNKK